MIRTIHPLQSGRRGKGALPRTIARLFWPTLAITFLLAAPAAALAFDSGSYAYPPGTVIDSYGRVYPPGTAFDSYGRPYLPGSGGSERLLGDSGSSGSCVDTSTDIDEIPWDGPPPGTQPADHTPDPIYVRWGSVAERAVDIRVPGPGFRWSQHRTYNSNVSGLTDLGGKWLGSNGDREHVKDGGPVNLNANANSSRLFSYDEETGYSPPNDSVLNLENVSGKLEMTNKVRGGVEVYQDLLGGSSPWVLDERTTRDWKEQKDGIAYSYTSGLLTQITTAEDQDYNAVYSYSGSGASSKLTSVVVEDAGTNEFQKVEYTYFNASTPDNHSSDCGSDGDLVQVKTSRLKTGGDDSNSADWIVRYTQYRYDSNGLLKAVFEPDAIQRIIDDRSDISTPADILTKDDDNDNSGQSPTIKEYANRQFTYYTTDLTTNGNITTDWGTENLQTTYGGSEADEVDAGAGTYLVKSETVGGCAGCGGPPSRAWSATTTTWTSTMAPTPRPMTWSGWWLRTPSTPTTTPCTGRSTGSARPGRSSAKS